jgi:Lar family restriction alleviation protein
MTTPSDASQAVELQPCPFCGGAARMTFVSDFRITEPRTGRRVVCSNCPGQTGAVAYEHEAIEAWNRRAAIAQDRAARAQAEPKLPDDELIAGLQDMHDRMRNGFSSAEPPQKLLRDAIAAIQGARAQGAGEAETFLIALHEWAVQGWRDEVQNRPLVNIHRKRLDDFWRKAISKAGGDPDAIVGPDHDTIIESMLANVGATTAPAARAQGAGEAVDAERYRFMRSTLHTPEDYLIRRTSDGNYWVSHEAMDAAVDAKRASAKSLTAPTIPQAAEVPGFVLVPREPTDAMLSAIPWPTSVTPKLGVECYRAMIAAAPTPTASAPKAEAVERAASGPKYNPVWAELHPCGDSWHGIDADGDGVMMTEGEFNESVRLGATVGDPESRPAPVAQAARAQGAGEAVRAALAELVACKDLKDAMRQYRSDPYYTTRADQLESQYEQRQPIAWDRARAALSAPTPIASAPKACPHGDRFCPCPDGDTCHYEGANPLPAPKAEGEAAKARCDAQDALYAKAGNEWHDIWLANGCDNKTPHEWFALGVEWAATQPPSEADRTREGGDVVAMRCCSLHEGQPFTFCATSYTPARTACPGCNPELFPSMKLGGTTTSEGAK